MNLPEFRRFPKISRLASPVVVTEKIDGTNGVVHVTDEGEVLAGSRTQWLVYSDNYGFGRWVGDNADDLAAMLGPGTHYGEWFGRGIQRGYGLAEKRFYLFQTGRYRAALYPDTEPPADGCETFEPIAMKGGAIGLVPVIFTAVEFMPEHVEQIADAVRLLGSRIRTAEDQQYDRPEGFVVFFEHNRTVFKVVLDKAGPPKAPRDPNRPAKTPWTPEMIEAARRAAAEASEVVA